MSRLHACVGARHPRHASPAHTPTQPASPSLAFVAAHREALRQAELGAGPLAADLADLQRQLAELVLQPIPLPAGSRASSRRSSRPASGRGAQQAAAGAAAELEPQSPLAIEGPEVHSPGYAQQQLGAAGSRHGSPRIRAVHSRAEQQAAEDAAALESSGHGCAAAERPSSLAMVSWASELRWLVATASAADAGAGCAGVTCSI